MWRQTLATFFAIILAALIIDWRVERRAEEITNSLGRVAKSLENLERDKMSATWVSGGVTQTYTLHSNEGESPDDFEIRFLRGLKTAMDAHKPDVPQ